MQIFKSNLMFFVFCVHHFYCCCVLTIDRTIWCATVDVSAHTPNVCLRLTNTGKINLFIWKYHVIFYGLCKCKFIFSGIFFLLSCEIFSINKMQVIYLFDDILICWYFWHTLHLTIHILVYTATKIYGIFWSRRFLISFRWRI